MKHIKRYFSLFIVVLSIVNITAAASKNGKSYETLAITLSELLPGFFDNANNTDEFFTIYDKYGNMINEQFYNDNLSSFQSGEWGQIAQYTKANVFEIGHDWGEEETRANASLETRYVSRLFQEVCSLQNSLYPFSRSIFVTITGSYQYDSLHDRINQVYEESVRMTKFDHEHFTDMYDPPVMKNISTYATRTDNGQYATFGMKYDIYASTGVAYFGHHNNAFTIQTNTPSETSSK